ncbi:hypothetical protein DTO96_100564 [Ephemeroptericola cinctiostellae]|uniref:Uncharacterized protein n=1 Tax=Ephemeroptericola cinctiostellae TaxID=2268024 RepID=A0A345D915_9BURK|nr:hypothetical protein DTO96_100564 [Ephemeroptericola cinctiostellae]
MFRAFKSEVLTCLAQNLNNSKHARLVMISDRLMSEVAVRSLKMPWNVSTAFPKYKP